MAFKLTKEAPSGVTGEYWRLIGIVADRGKDSVELVFGLYVNKQSVTSKKQPLMTAKLATSWEKWSKQKGNVISNSYKLLHKEPGLEKGAMI